jgi:N6-adenosine-specific RNA methylase IME4
MKADDRHLSSSSDRRAYMGSATGRAPILSPACSPRAANQAPDQRRRSQGIIEPRRQHSRKPDCVPGRIERLVAGPYLELFARTQRPGWTVWGNQTDKFEEAA